MQVVHLTFLNRITCISDLPEVRSDSSFKEQPKHNVDDKNHVTTQGIESQKSFNEPSSCNVSLQRFDSVEIIGTPESYSDGDVAGKRRPGGMTDGDGLSSDEHSDGPSSGVSKNAEASKGVVDGNSKSEHEVTRIAGFGGQAREKLDGEPLAVEVSEAQLQESSSKFPKTSKYVIDSDSDDENNISEKQDFAASPRETKESSVVPMKKKPSKHFIGSESEDSENDIRRDGGSVGSPPEIKKNRSISKKAKTSRRVIESDSEEENTVFGIQQPERQFHEGENSRHVIDSDSENDVFENQASRESEGIAEVSPVSVNVDALSRSFQRLESRSVCQEQTRNGSLVVIEDEAREPGRQDIVENSEKLESEDYLSSENTEEENSETDDEISETRSDRRVARQMPKNSSEGNVTK